MKKIKPFIIFFVFFGLLLGMIYFTITNWPKYEELFFEFGLLGRKGTAENYYRNDNSTIFIGTPMSWQIYVHNHMGNKQRVSIRVKILNSTMQAPIDHENEPSPEPHFIEYPLSLSTDETTSIPFSWSILDMKYRNGTVINRLIINGEITEFDIKSNFDSYFRFIFELWVYDETSDEYNFGWYFNDEFYSASLYVWFNAIVARF